MAALFGRASLLSRRFVVAVGGGITFLGIWDAHPSYCMPPRRRGPIAGAPLPAPASPFTLSLISGDPAAKTEDLWQLDSICPAVEALAFIEWVIDDGPPAVATAPRSVVTAALLPAVARPSLLELSRLEEYPFLSSEVDAKEATSWLEALDSAKAFDSVYPSFGDWAKVSKTFQPLAANPDHLNLTEDSFEETEDWDEVSSPEVGFLARATIADLIRVENSKPDDLFQHDCLARAFLIFGSKSSNDFREEESSGVRLAAEVVAGILTKDMLVASPSSSGLAARMCKLFRDVHLPATFCSKAWGPSVALRDFELGYTHSKASLAEAVSIERDLFLNTEHTYPLFEPLLQRFTSGPEAAVQFDRLCLQLLPTNLSSAAYLIRLPALASLFSGASWQAATTHLLNDDANISGENLVSALIKTHTEVTSRTSGDGGSGSGADTSLMGASSSSEPSSYGSVRELSIGDALRASEATEALGAAEDLSGVQRVATIMRSGSVLLTRAELLQESWLHNKHAVLAFCSLDRPHLCPYFATMVTEDKDTGEVPARLLSYTFPEAELKTLRTPTWSNLNLLPEALKIRHLQYGTKYASVPASEIYTVESCLRIIREHGARLFFALNLGLQPIEGLSFTDGVDLQLRAVEFANTLPKAEGDEWKIFLNAQFRENWLDGGGAHYHSKLRTGRPDSEAAQLSEFQPSENAYFLNVNARLSRAEPVAEFRIAFPTMFSSDVVSLPGTSGAVVKPPKLDSPNPKDKGKGKDKGSKRTGTELEGPGSKSHFASQLSPSELFLSGVVFQLDKIAQHYRIANPDRLCWPVLLTKKKGPAALELCPDHATHGDLKQYCHKRPASFDLEYVYKHFTRAATAAENKKAGWKSVKKGKA